MSTSVAARRIPSAAATTAGKRSSGSGGTGTAIVNDERHPLAANVLLLIEHGDRHEIRNDGDADLVTLNFYVPPAYTADGDELPAGKPGEAAR